MPLSPRLRWKLDRFRENLSRLLGDKKEDARPSLCPVCGQLVGAAQTRCHQCGTSLTFSLAALGKSLGGLIPSESPVTWAMVGVNLLIYGVCLLATIQASSQLNLKGAINGPVLYRLGARQGLGILQGEWWRLVMPIFLHGNLLHIGFNVYVLWDCGTQVEEIYGSARTLFLYVTTGILSFVWSTLWNLFVGNPYGLSFGASGALMGLVGLMLAIATRRGGAYMREIRTGLIRWVVIIFALGYLMGGTDNAAHLGGLVAGYALGQIFDDRQPQHAAERQRAYMLGAAAFVVVLGSFAAMMLHYYRAGS